MTRLFSVVAAIAAAALVRPSHAQSPPGFEPFSTSKLTVQYGSTSLSAGMALTPAGAISPVPALRFLPTLCSASHLTPHSVVVETQHQPTIGAANIPSNGPFILIMVDADAPSHTNMSLADVLHWSLPDLSPVSPTNRTLVPSPGSHALSAYIGPAPSRGSGPHRYILTLFAQPSTFTVPPAFAGYGLANHENITRFNLTDFVRAANLGPPVAANYFIAENKTVAGGNGSTPATTTTTVPFTGMATGRRAAAAAGGAMGGLVLAMAVVAALAL